MHIVFYSTSDVFKGEDRLKHASIDCSVVPTPVQDKAYCGVCLRTQITFDKKIFDDMEYAVLEE